MSQKESGQRRYSLTERADDRTGRDTEKKRLRKRRSFNGQGRRQDWSKHGGKSGALTFQPPREGTGKEQLSDKRRRNWRGVGAVVKRAEEGAGSGSTSGCGPEMREGGCCAACDL